MSLRLGIDIGGTFTDLVTMDQQTGTLSMLKTPSTPAHPSRAVINGIDELVTRDRIEPSQIAYFVHGTTLALNTVIQRSGALTGLLVTRGFGDILELQRLRLPDPHHFNAERPRALVMRRHVRQIDERVLANGDVYQPLDLQQCVDAARELQRLGVESLAICFLHAYRNPAHEIAAHQAIAEAMPDLYVCRSSDVWPQQREYERSLATVINAFVGDRMQRYFASLEGEVSAMGVPAPVLSTKSNGGVMSAASAGKAPVQTLLSGPASGVIGARYIGELAGEQRLLTFAEQNEKDPGNPFHELLARDAMDRAEAHLPENIVSGKRIAAFAGGGVAGLLFLLLPVTSATPALDARPPTLTIHDGAGEGIYGTVSVRANPCLDRSSAVHCRQLCCDLCHRPRRARGVGAGHLPSQQIAGAGSGACGGDVSVDHARCA